MNSTPSRLMIRAALVAVAAFAAPLAALAPAQAQLVIDVRNPNANPLPIAVVDFVGDPVGAQIAKVVSDNLQGSGLFAPIDQRSHIEKIANPNATPRFADWRAINAQGLVVGAAQQQADGRLRVEFRLWDVTVGQQLTGLAYFTQPANFRRIAHIISDQIYKRITGEEGYFDTRVVYVAESGPGNARVKRLALMDQDGANHRYLTDGRSLMLTPRFSPTLQEVTYMAYPTVAGQQPRVYVYNVDSGRQELLGNFPGMTFAPRFSPEGNRVIMSLQQGGASDLYVLDVRSRSSQRLTSHPSINTSPSFSPDGRQIVFNSDRSGQQQLYVMDSSGGGERRISFGSGRYATPVWSPRGDLIAFTKMEGGRFAIGVMRPDGSGERILDTGFLVEGPSWAPNGRVLMYYAQEPSSGGRVGASRIYSIDITGRNRRQIPTPGDASDPAWSPLIPQ